MSGAIRVTLADAPTDVLVYLVDHGAATVRQIDEAVAPDDLDGTYETVVSAVVLLRQLGYIEARSGLGGAVWAATDSGRAAVANARQGVSGD